jgi:hypothetical protein
MMDQSKLEPMELAACDAATHISRSEEFVDAELVRDLLQIIRRLCGQIDVSRSGGVRVGRDPGDADLPRSDHRDDPGRGMGVVPQLPPLARDGYWYGKVGDEWCAGVPIHDGTELCIWRLPLLVSARLRVHLKEQGLRGEELESRIRATLAWSKGAPSPTTVR